MPGSQTCSPNSHRKPHRNVLRVFDVCSEKQCVSKSYFAFVVETFSDIAHTEIPRSRNSCMTTLSVTVSSRQSVQQSKSARAMSLNSCEFLYQKSKIIFTIALHFLTNIKYSRFDETFCGNSVNNFDCRAFSRHVNKGKMHKITISSNSSCPCGKRGSTKLGVQELEVDNIVFD